MLTINFVKSVLDFMQYKSYNEDILRLAKLEYPKDWQYAYEALISGKQPENM